MVLKPGAGAGAGAGAAAQQRLTEPSAGRRSARVWLGEGYFMDSFDDPLALRLMSRALTLCVSAPKEMKSTPALA